MPVYLDPQALQSLKNESILEIGGIVVNNFDSKETSNLKKFFNIKAVKNNPKISSKLGERHVCVYGAHCYRRDEAHLTKFHSDK